MLSKKAKSKATFLVYFAPEAFRLEAETGHLHLFPGVSRVGGLANWCQGLHGCHQTLREEKLPSKKERLRTKLFLLTI